MDACSGGGLPARVVAVISNQTEAYGVERARQAHLPALVLAKRKEQDRRAYDAQLADLAQIFRPDLVILAGWMRLLSNAFLSRFPERVINLHPALPGMFPGTHAIQRAYEAYQAGQITHTGVMVHLVPDEGVDNGPVLASVQVPIHPGEPLESLEARVHKAEHALLVRAIKEKIQTMGRL